MTSEANPDAKPVENEDSLVEDDYEVIVLEDGDPSVIAEQVKCYSRDQFSNLLQGILR